MATPVSAKTRQSGIPTPGKPSGLPTPGAARVRSTSSANQYPPQPQDDEYAARAFADAIKANDPALHRPGRSSDVSNVSLSPSTSITFPASQSGRRSVAGRPSSVASSSSAISAAASRTPGATPKVPGPRPASRQSDVFTRSASRAGRSFEEGDNVRIESLGYEGTLKYLGEIDGKPGHWAGVELSGGFAGKGKNNGAVNGKQYFVCPPNCGVFVASTKLSAPTVGSSRPSSVASSRNGRITPSFSLSGRITPSASTSTSTGRKTPSFSNGRATPSLPNGRVTPSAGRKTPGVPVPATRARSVTGNARAAVDAITPVRPAAAQNIITPGSRASKYVGVTARQLSSRGSGTASPSRVSSGLNSPTRTAGKSSPAHFSSPPRSLPSPFNTPKASYGSRTSGIGVGVPPGSPSRRNTPRARVPSGIAMPPPASPSIKSGRSISVTMSDQGFSHRGANSLTDLESNGKALQDKIAQLMAGRVPRPGSSASGGSSGHSEELQQEIERLHARLTAAEDENRRLRESTDAQNGAVQRAEKLAAEQKQSATRITELESIVRANERLLNERETAIEAVERAAKEKEADIEKIKSDADARLRDIQSKLDDKEALVDNLKELIEAKEGLQTENDAVLQAKNAEITLLEARVQKAYAELEDERQELGAQVEELRKAGQETIALYEERLSAADTQRYELEDLIASLDEQLRAKLEPLSPVTAQRQATSAVEIDNESLREQVQHLQKRIAVLEDQLEEAHATFDREEAAVRERAKRYKEREDALQQEVNDGKKEVERLLKTEESARQRIEEMDDALRENKHALENARAEIEILRSEIAALESITSGITDSNSSEKVADLVQRSTTRLTEEIAHLKQRLAESDAQSSHVSASASSDHIVQDLRELVANLQAERDSLQQMCEEHAAELENIRKKSNRDVPVNAVESGKTPSKHDLAAARDEITGLKHIVQELQKENSAAAQRNKVLESENRLLLSETEQLREDLKVLEENIEQSILREEALESSDGSVPTSAAGDVAVLHKKYEAELEQVRRRLAEAEMKSARTIHDLNKEIGELETLVESKIYREDELERELERLREKVARSQKKSSKLSTEPPAAPPDERPVGSGAKKISTEPVSAGTQEVCEICERPGHDIFTCDLLKDDVAPMPMSAPAMSTSMSMSSMSSMSMGGDADEELFCEDCEGRGHTAENCPHSLDVF